MKLIGYLIIFWSVINLLINTWRLFAFREIKRKLRQTLGSEGGGHVNVAFADQVEYDWGLLVFSLGALPIGIYLALNGATLWQLVGYVLLLMSLGGIIQSFRPTHTSRLLAQRGDYETPVNKMALRLRMISVVELVIGIYLIAK